MITAVVTVTDATGNKLAAFKKNKDGVPAKVEPEIWHVANAIQDLNSDSLIDGLSSLPSDAGWTKLTEIPKDLFLACDYLFEAKVTNLKRLNLRECRQD